MFKDFFLKFRNSRGFIPFEKSRPKVAEATRLWRGRSQTGFTLVEILVTASLIVFITSAVIRNFSASRLNLERVANVMASDIRLAQQLALSSYQYKGPIDPVPRNRCGYGVTQDPSNPQQGYIVYVGPATVKPDGTPNNCGDARQYQSSQDTPAYKSVLLDLRINFRDNPGQGNLFKDLYFEPPSPTVYFGNQLPSPNPADPETYFERVVIKKIGVGIKGGPPGSSCEKGNPDCIYICVYVSGRVEVSKTWTCPVPF